MAVKAGKSILLLWKICSVSFFQQSLKVASSLSDVWVDTQRRRHLAYLMADQGAIVNPESARNLPKQVNWIITI